MEEACKRANIPPADVAYVEAHATGTPVGDPIEVSFPYFLSDVVLGIVSNFNQRLAQ
jgi:hypothetical protein